MKFYQSLKFKLPAFLLAGTIPIAALALFSASNLAKDEIASHNDLNLELKTKLIATSVSQWYSTQELALRTLSSQPAIVSMKPELQKRILVIFANNYPDLYRAMTFDTNGYNIARNDSNQLKYRGDRYYFRAAMRGTEVAAQTIVGRTTGKLSVCMGSSIVNTQVEVVGVATVCSYLEQITKGVGQLNFGKTGYAIVVDRDGHVLAHPNATYRVGDSLKNLGEFPPVKNLLLSGNSEFTFDDEGEKWVSRSVRLDNGWGVVVIMSEAEFLASEQGFTHAMLLFGAIALLGLAAFTWFVARNSLTPIAELTAAAEDIAAGKYREVSIASDDELGTVAKILNETSIKLRSYLEGIKRHYDGKITTLKTAITAEKNNNKKKQIELQTLERSYRNLQNNFLKNSQTHYAILLETTKYLEVIRAENPLIRKVSIYIRNLLQNHEQILYFARLERRTTSVKETNVNLNSFCAEIIDNTREIARAKKSNVNLSTKGILPVEIKTDPDLLRQVVMQLLSNAIRFSPNGSEVILRVTPISSDEKLKRAEILFEIIDAGIGIHIDNQPKIFTPYFQVGNSEGVGLGLSIVHNLVGALGGKISVKSQLNSGSNFSFQLNFKYLVPNNVSYLDSQRNRTLPPNRLVK